jgi:hypothetical protein
MPDICEKLNLFLFKVPSCDSKLATRSHILLFSERYNDTTVLFTKSRALYSLNVKGIHWQAFILSLRINNKDPSSANSHRIAQVTKMNDKQSEWEHQDIARNIDKANISD